jgi:hypothetical protein
MIKVISYKDEGIGEVEILKYLSSEPLKSDIDNPIVPILEFLHYNDWTFVVQPRWSECVEPESFNVGQGVELCVQVDQGEPFFLPVYCASADSFKGNCISSSSSCCSFGMCRKLMLKLPHPIVYAHE